MTDHLRDWLRGGDPTAAPSGAMHASRPPTRLDPASLEAVMNEIVSTPPTPDAAARRRPPFWAFGPAAAAAAVMVLVALVGGGVWWSQRTPANAPIAAPSATSITLTDIAQDPSASCMRAEAATMRANADLALAGTVRATSATSATIAVERWYRGGTGPATIVVQRPADTAPGILYSPELTAGQRVLLVAKDGALHLCDPTGPWSPEAEQLYVAAFGPGTPAT
ncbi:MAG: hypothetical protein IPG94_03680 [Kineosporiaceae bacterium]|nr:hypothetical protein [Kineosporiaceae bacterium]